jgi:hypothetical protein
LSKSRATFASEIKNWIENYSEIENLIADLDLEFDGAY